MSSQITCPSCSMSASSSDHRQLAPVPVERLGVDLRRCRNCGDQFEVRFGRVSLADRFAG